MNREILFRGKNINNGYWEYGVLFLINSEEKSFIINNCSTLDFNSNTSFKGIEVDPKTVGQYTGLKDKNGVKIFEGDLLKINSIQKASVIFKDGRFCLLSKFVHDTIYSISSLKELEVIGNIHDK